VGNYRILYSIESGENVLLIVNIDKRSRVYHR
jgi:mRNA-degrading endonuclease RelE of RelBE toxin-antitoxin system